MAMINRDPKDVPQVASFAFTPEKPREGQRLRRELSAGPSGQRGDQRARSGAASAGFFAGLARF